jgi:uncharacterized membrane protein
MRYGLSLAALAGILVVGCNKSPEGGEEGTSNTFSISAPTMSTTIKQGDKQSVKITLNRNKDFKQNVKLSAKSADEKVKPDFAKDMIAMSDPAEVVLTIDVAKDTPTGDHTIHVTGTPDGGKPTSVDVKIKVDKNP